MQGRAFDKAEDMGKLQAFLVEMRHQVGQAAYFQWGDVLWRMHYGPNGFDETRDIRLWCDQSGKIAGLVFYLPSHENPEFFLRPELYDSPIADAMVAWGMARAAADNALSIETSCIDCDAAKAAFLKRQGFQLYNDVMVFMTRRLDDPIPVGQLPKEYGIVSSADRPDLAKVTGKSMTPAHYAQICNAPGYKHDLGLRVCYQGQEIVSGCIGWYDALDRCGEFEPVGTSEGHRRKGLAFAVMAKVMENLRRYGAETVYVRAYKDNGPAVRLYQKLGFHITNEDYGWKRAVMK
jgi:GNAT superfamily N-acetyltransferase